MESDWSGWLPVFGHQGILFYRLEKSCVEALNGKVVGLRKTKWNAEEDSTSLKAKAYRTRARASLRLSWGLVTSA